jgi:hypothetical protein
LTFVREVDLTSMTSFAGQGELDQTVMELRATLGKLEAAKAQRDRAFQLIIEGESDYLKGKLRELDASVSDLERRESELSNKHRQLTAEARSLSRSKAEVAELIDRIQGDSGDSGYAMRSTLAARLRDMIEMVGVFPGRKKSGGYFVVHFKDGTRRVVAPWGDDPTKFRAIGHTHEGIVGEPVIRFLLARYGFTNPTVEQYDEMTEDLMAAGRNQEALGEAAVMPLHEKWAKRRIGRDEDAAERCAEVLTALKKKYKEQGIE